MTRRTLLGIASAVLVMSAGARMPSGAKEAQSPPDLTGDWRLDPSRSDSPRASEVSMCRAQSGPAISR